MARPYRVFHVRNMYIHTYKKLKKGNRSCYIKFFSNAENTSCPGVTRPISEKRKPVQDLRLNLGNVTKIYQIPSYTAHSLSMYFARPFAPFTVKGIAARDEFIK